MVAYTCYKMNVWRSEKRACGKVTASCVVLRLAFPQTVKVLYLKCGYFYKKASEIPTALLVFVIVYFEIQKL